MTEAHRLERMTEAGFAQVLVLAGLLGLSGFVTALLVSQQSAAKLVAALEDQVRGRWLATSAIRSLLENDRRLSSVLAMGQEPISIHVEDTEVVVRFEAEAGKINPLETDPAILREYLRNAGLSDVDQRDLVDEISKLDDPIAALRFLLLELGAVVPEDSLRQDVTSVGASPGIDPMFATERVLQALPDLADAEVQEVIRLRGTSPEQLAGFSRYFAQGEPWFAAIASVSFAREGLFEMRIPFELLADGSARIAISY